MVSVVGIQGSIKTVRALDKGLSRHGDQYNFVTDLNDPKTVNADMFVQTNLIKPKIAQSPQRREAYRYILNSNKPFLVIESPVFRRYPELKYTRLGWWSYKWTDGNFNNTNSPSDRWNAFQKESGIEIKDWHSPGDAILFMGQKEGDSSLLELYKDYDSFYDWVAIKIKEIRKYSDRPIILRPHPRNYSHGHKLAKRLKASYKNVTVSEDPVIENDFAKAYCVVTYNSLSGVESVCDGIPTFALDNGSMVWPVTHHHLSQLESINYNIDRTQWCNDVAYTHWSAKENRKGESWAHLKPVFFN